MITYRSKANPKGSGYILFLQGLYWDTITFTNSSDLYILSERGEGGQQKYPGARAPDFTQAGVLLLSHSIGALLPSQDR